MNEGDGVDERVPFYVVELDLIVDGKCLVCCAKGREVVGVALWGEWSMIVQFVKRIESRYSQYVWMQILKWEGCRCGMKQDVLFGVVTLMAVFV